MDLQNEKCVIVIDENLPLGIIEIEYPLLDFSQADAGQSVPLKFWQMSGRPVVCLQKQQEKKIPDLKK